MNVVEEERMAWVARAKCGHIVAAHAPATEASREWVADGAPKGATLEVVTSAQVRHEGFCPGHVESKS